MPKNTPPAKRYAPRFRSRWFVAALALAVIAAVVTTLWLVDSRSRSSGSRSLSASEADRLAVMRYRNYQLHGRSVLLTVPTVAGTLTVRGSVDFRAHVGYGVIKGSGQSAATRGLVQWTLRSIIEHPLADAAATAPAVPPTSGWIGRPLTPTASALDAALVLVMNLAANRPDNAQLLVQDGASWLRSATIRSSPVDVFAGPSPSGRAEPHAAHASLRYWIAREGTLYRVESAAASAPQPVTVELGAAPYVTVKPVPGLR